MKSRGHGSKWKTRVWRCDPIRTACLTASCCRLQHLVSGPLTEALREVVSGWRTSECSGGGVEVTVWLVGRDSSLEMLTMKRGEEMGM